MIDNFAFGYPRECTRCAGIPANPGARLVGLRVEPFLKSGTGSRIMLVGQDPTIARRPERVKQVLMLNVPNGQLSRWLEGVFGASNFQTATIYATNVVKCTFSSPPSSRLESGLNVLKPYFQNCQRYLPAEVFGFRPHCVITLGEPAHRLFVSLLDNASEIPNEMKSAFTGRFIKARLHGFEFDYSPCLHIQTFRVAETYGAKVESFKQELLTYFETGHNEP